MGIRARDLRPGFHAKDWAPGWQKFQRGSRVEGLEAERCCQLFGPDRWGQGERLGDGAPAHLLSHRIVPPCAPCASRVGPSCHLVGVGWWTGKASHHP